jgi:hypothetical protein
MLKKILNLIKHSYSRFKKKKKYLKFLNPKPAQKGQFRFGPARLEITHGGEGLGRHFVRPPGPNQVQNVADHPSGSDGRTSSLEDQNPPVPVTPSEP